MRVARVILPVGSVHAAGAFYGRVLGSPGTRVSAARHDFALGDVVVSCEEGVGGPASICLATGDLAGARKRLVAELGERGVGPIEDDGAGERWVMASDPWGNRLRVIDDGAGERAEGPRRD